MEVYGISFGPVLPNTPSLTDCQRSCAANSECTAFTFQRELKFCFLYSSASRLSANYEFEFRDSRTLTLESDFWMAHRIKKQHAHSILEDCLSATHLGSSCKDD